MFDKTGRELGLGDVVDVVVDDPVMSGVIVEVSDGGMLGGDGRPIPAKIVISVPVRIEITPGAPAPVYCIRKSKPKERTH